LAGLDFGIKVRTADDRLIGTLGLFQEKNGNIRIENTALEAIHPEAGKLIDVSGLQETEGCELQFLARPVADLQVIVNWTYMPTSKTVSNNQLTGADLAYVLSHRRGQDPRNYGGVFLRYDFKNTSLNGLWIGAGARYTGARDAMGSDIDFQQPEPAYTLIDADMGYQWRWGKVRNEISLAIENLTNKRYFGYLNLGEPFMSYLRYTVRF
jgi:outer membrane receptor protein involved in Fe transport